MVQEHAKDENDVNEMFQIAQVNFLIWGMFLIPGLKHQSFSEEKEWRYVIYVDRTKRVDDLKFRSSVRGVVPYLCFPLAEEDSPISIKKIYVGPSSHSSTSVASARILLRNNGYNDEKIIRQSKIPLRV